MKTHDSIAFISILTTDQMQNWLDGNLAGRGEHHFRRLAGFWQDVEQGTRIIWGAWQGDRLLGQITLQHDSYYPPFKRGGVFEIVDLWVDPTARKQGIGRKLLDAVCAYAVTKGCTHIGMGVGITADFGAAHRLYASHGFAPDGTGLWVQGAQAKEGDTITLQDGVIMMWVKKL